MLPPASAKKTAYINLRTSRGVKEVIEQAAVVKAAKRAVEIAIEQDEAAGIAYLASVGAT
jgi:uncharacterized protein (DUF1778 family)